MQGTNENENNDRGWWWWRSSHGGRPMTSFSPATFARPGGEKVLLSGVCVGVGVWVLGTSAPISSKGFMLILTLLVSTPELSGFTRIFTA